jgi:Protein of unknown function (DUF3300)
MKSLALYLQRTDAGNASLVRRVISMRKRSISIILAGAVLAVIPALAQPLMPPAQLDNVVERIALYPDPLLAQVLTASTFWDQIPDAAAWANEHSYLQGDALAQAIAQDQLPWDPSVLALLPFPSVLDMMARDPGWTQALGNAVLAQRPDVMDAVQRMRHRAMDYGYLRDTPQYRVVDGPYIEILPVDPAYVVVPRYDPYVVFAAPRRGYYMGGAITFGPRVFIGSAFAPWGWRNPAFGWRDRTIVIDRHPWDRRWDNRDRYAHPYATPVPRYSGPRVERHEHADRYRRDRR